MPSQDRVPIEGSEHALAPDSQETGAPDPGERIEVTVRVRPRPSGKGLPSAEEMGSLLPSQREYMSRDQLDTEQGADPADIAMVEDFARQHSLHVVEANPATRSVVLAGSAGDMAGAFGVGLKNYDSPHGAYRASVGSVHVPADLGQVVEGVFGLDSRRQARPY
jgi:kumamolisin